MNYSRSVLLVIFLLLIPKSQAAEFLPLGYLPGGYFSGAAVDVSADGSVVVGRSHSSYAGLEAFRWTRSTGMVGLGDFPEADAWSGASAVSGDGSVVIGRGTAVFYAGVDAFRWTAATGLQLIGYFPREGDLFSYATVISNDGKVIGGSSDNRAFLWTEMSGIKEIPGISDVAGNSGIGGLSADGSVAAGSRQINGVIRPFRLSAPNHIEDLGSISGSGVDYSVTGLSADGSVVIGTASRQGWRWDETTGMQAIPRLPESDFAVYPADLTADGSIIVGTTTASTDPAARFPSFIWTRERGTENLETFLREQHGLDFSGWTLSRVSAISNNGLVIVGGGVNPAGRLEAWLVDLRVPEPGTLFILLPGVAVAIANLRSRRVDRRLWLNSHYN